jgi:hypothetical protein
MDSSVSPKDEIWFLRVYHHISKRSLVHKFEVTIGDRKDSSVVDPSFPQNIYCLLTDKDSISQRTLQIQNFIFFFKTDFVYN